MIKPFSLERLSFDELDRQADMYDRAVLRAPDVDRFCSSSPWILPAARWLHRFPPPCIAHEGDSWVVLCGTRHLHPLEAMWGLPCPLIGAEPAAAVALFLKLVGDAHRPVLLAGIVRDSPLEHELAVQSRHLFTMLRGPATRRYLADIEGGVEPFLTRRSGHFRKSARRAWRRCEEAGVRFEDADGMDADASFESILAIERRSWKGLRGVGIDTEPMHSFYKDMNRRLVERRARRLAFATLEGERVAYILGGVFGDTYRGLQFSFDHRLRELSLGNSCQMNEIRRLSQRGVVRYDLGTEVSYKQRWADTVFSTASLVLHPR